VDLGCGAGELTRVLHEHTRAAETLGIDSSEAMLAKMVDFSAMTGKFWFFHTGLTNLEYTLTLTDSVTGAVKTYEGRGDFCAGADVHAFAD
jgi:ubiquinone/menaquinone biosynthesis C-methylase UbiE